MMSMLLTKAKLSLAAIAVGSCLVMTTAIFVGPGLRAAAQETIDAKNLPGGEGRRVRNPSSEANPVLASTAPKGNSSARKSEPASQDKQSAQEPNLTYRHMPAP
jgi:hypothetical protein